MKTRFVSVLLVAGLALVVGAQQKPDATSSSSHDQRVRDTAAGTTDTARSGEIIKRGAPLGDSPVVAFADVLKEPQKYADQMVLIEGIVERVCTNKGCWMELAPKAGADESVRVTFKDYGFFVPTGAKEMKVKAEGKFTVKVLTKEKADHYANEGARIKRNADATAHEVTFVATGIELRKS